MLNFGDMLSHTYIIRCPAILHILTLAELEAAASLRLTRLLTLNLTSGTLKYKLKGDDTKWQYKVPNVSVFVDDVNETVREHNKNAKSDDDMIKYELISGSSTSWFVNLLPTIIMGVLLVILLVIMMRRMNTMGGDMNKTLNFGKINAKKQQDQK